MRPWFSIFVALISFCHAEDSIELLISQDQITEQIEAIAKTINQEYAEKELKIIMVMKGALCVTADLIRFLDIPFTIDYLKASSYGAHGMTPGQLKINHFEDIEIEGKDILVVDDVFDTGNTMTSLISFLQEKNPASLKSLVLLVKDVPRKISYRPDFVLFDIPNRFVIGYGLDYKEFYRGLPGVFAFVNDTPPSDLSLCTNEFKNWKFGKADTVKLKQCEAALNAPSLD